jgi:PilZ domain
LEKDKTSESAARHPRHPFSQKVTFELSAPLTLQEFRQEEMKGNTQNVSKGGLCLITDHVLEESQIIKIKFPVLNGAAVVPTLARVQWVKKQPSVIAPAAVRQAIAGRRREQYIAGLCFLL